MSVMELISLILTLLNNLFEFSQNVFNYILLNSLTIFFVKMLLKLERYCVKGQDAPTESLK